MIVAVAVAVAVAGTVIVAVHVHVNAPVGVIEGRKVAEGADRRFLQGMQQHFASIPDGLWQRIEAWIPRHPPDPSGGRPRIRTGR